MRLLLNWRIVRRINIIVNVSIAISHRWLLRCEPPFIVNYELVLMNPSFESLDQRELIAILLHRDSFSPLVEAADQKYLFSSEVPSENYID